MASEFTALELMLHVATAKGIVGWAKWCEAYESVTKVNCPNALTPTMATRILDNLGHLEVATINGDLKVAVSPAVLARLPHGGLPVAVLCGGRSPQVERKLRDAAQNTMSRLSVIENNNAWQPAPKSMFVEAEDSRRLEETARLMGIPFSEVPPAWSLINSVSGIEAFTASLSWRHEPEPTIESNEFNVGSWRFGTTQRGKTGTRVIRYFPRRLPSYFDLREGEKAARTDKDYGVYAALHGHGRNTLIHDSKSKIIAVPSSLPLPRLFGRALSLCSGLAPFWLPVNENNWGLPESRGYLVYTSIPDTIADVFFAKIGQSPLPFHVTTSFLRKIQSNRR